MHIESDQLQSKNADLSGLDVRARLFISPRSTSSPTRLTLGHASSAIEPSQCPSNMLVHSCTFPGLLHWLSPCTSSSFQAVLGEAVWHVLWASSHPDPPSLGTSTFRILRCGRVHTGGKLRMGR